MASVSEENRPRSVGGSRQTWKERFTVALNVILATVVAFELILLGYRVYSRWDLTQDETFSISERTKRFLGSLENRMKITVFYGREYPPHAWTWQRIHDLLQEFQLHADRIEVEFVDPHRDPSRAQQLRQKFGISANDFQSGAVAFEYGDASQVAVDASIVEYEVPPGAARADPTRDRKTFRGEETFLSVMTSLAEGQKPLALMLSGHGEYAIDGQEPFGFYRAAQLLRSDGYEVKPLTLGADTPSVPAGADLVIVAHPRAPLPKGDVQALKRYAEGGGDLLLLPSFEFRQGETSPIDMNLDPLLEHFGIALGDKLLVEDQHRTRPDVAQVLRVRKYNEKHPATRSLGEGEEKPTIFMTARAVRPAGENAVPVVFSTPTTIEKGDIAEIWDLDRYRNLLNYRGSLFNPEKDKRGPFSLVCASEVKGNRPEESARCVVAATANFVSNAGLAQPLFNGDLFMNLVNWLTKRESHMGIAPKHPREVTYTVHPSTRRKVFWLIMVVMPLTAIVAGAAVWLSRRT